MVTPSSWRYALWAGATVLLSAFLLFLVQPLISHAILPWFGGGPAVWTTCMLFFQIALLGGYSYAHGLSLLGEPRRQWLIHIALLVAALCLLPILPSDGWHPTDSARPVARILVLLSVCVGLPYFLLSSTGPLVQAWYARVMSGSPYRLYALSNVGSLAALLVYPVWIEPHLETPAQAWVWSGGFALFAVLAATLAWWTAKLASVAGSADTVTSAATGASAADAGAHGAPAEEEDDEPVSNARLLRWLALAALPSTMLLATTARLCQDVAVSPFMWVIPLALYLLTFIICFDREQWYRPLLLPVLAWFALLALANVLLADEMAPVYQQLSRMLAGIGEEQAATTAYPDWIRDYGDLDNSLLAIASTALPMLFLLCMVCHGELVRSRPHSRQLTLFYLVVSAGGALGGILVGVVCPLVFTSYMEWHLGLIVSYLFVSWLVLARLPAWWTRRRKAPQPAAPAAKTSRPVKPSVEPPSGGNLLVWRFVFGALGAAGLFVIGWSQGIELYDSDTVVDRGRSFYGVLRVKDDDDGETRSLFNGRILHGTQRLAEAERREPTTYYVPGSGVELAIHQGTKQGPRRVGVIGLGAGTIACYGEPDDHYVFYEINPQCVEFAQKYFSYLADSPATTEVVLGDARISLAHEAPRDLDVLVVDAFSGDAIPVHLLTVEAGRVFQRHLREHGVIALHISNRYLDLAPVAEGLARELGMTAAHVRVDISQGYGQSSEWVLLTRDAAFLQRLEEQGSLRTPPRRVVVWTDHHSNLWEILN